jgi:hypothetical protein
MCKTVQYLSDAESILLHGTGAKGLQKEAYEA